MSEEPDTPRRSGRPLPKGALLSLLGLLIVVVAYGLLQKPNGATAPRASGAGSPVSRTAPADPVVVSEAAVKGDIAVGRPVVLLFMATGCSSCAEAALGLTSAARPVNQATRPANRVLLVGVDIASSDDLQTLGAFVSEAQLAELPITWTVDSDGSLATQYQDQTLDETVGLVNDQVRFHNPSWVDTGQLQRQLRALL